MHVDLTALNGYVLGKFGTRKAFGERMGWHPCKVTRILRGYQLPTLDECWKIGEACGLGVRLMGNVFFAEDDR